MRKTIISIVFFMLFLAMYPLITIYSYSEVNAVEVTTTEPGEGYNISVKPDYTGLVPCKDGQWYYVEKGIYDQKYSGISKSTNGKLYYVKDGIWNTSYTGLAPYTDGKWYYVKDGRHTSYSGLSVSTNGKYYYVNQGLWDTSYTGLAPYTDGRWYYVKNGRYDSNYSGISKSTNGKLYYVKGGIWDTSYTGLAPYTDGKWYYVEDGRHISYTGVSVSTNGKLYYVKDGIWDTTYTGLAPYYVTREWLYMRAGRHDSSYSGISRSTDGKLYFVKNGKYFTGYSGVLPYSDGDWYYLKNGKVDYSFSGLKTDRTGTWLYRNGKIDKSYTGKYDYNDFYYNIVQGKSTDFPESMYGSGNGRKMFIIGDSRTAQSYSSKYTPNNWKDMSEKNYIVKGLEIWKAQGGSGYEYLVKSLSEITDKVDNVTDVVILSGYNNCRIESIGNFTSEYLYLEIINKKAKEFTEKGANIYYVAVAPGVTTSMVVGTNQPRNSKIEEWNDILKRNLCDEVVFIDIDESLNLKNCTYDGIHFDKQTNEKFMKYVLDCRMK